jgi:hypothetical protein
MTRSIIARYDRYHKLEINSIVDMISKVTQHATSLGSDLVRTSPHLTA